MLMHRRYPPYSKWLGTAVARLEGAGTVARLCLAAITATTWADRERALCATWGELARIHNDLGLTKPIDATVRPFYDRPYRVIDAGRFVTALRDSITDDRIRGLPTAGAVDQFVDSTDAIADAALRLATIEALIGR
jgi:hypothetical protein